MATKQQINDFISTIGPLVQKYAKLRGYRIASTVIAQACLESAYGTCALSKYYNYFGMKCGGCWKGPSVNVATKEEYQPGVLTNIRDNFRAYDSMESGVAGYYDFINWSNYANLKVVNTYQMYAQCLKQDGWATDSQYVAKLCKIVEDYNLTRFDDFNIENISYKKYVVSHEKGLNVRKGPGTDYPVISCLKYEEGFEVSKISNGWGYIPIRDGWCCLEYAKEK
ncbi:MAG: glucosaminidase domain-containing protein [Bacteroidales bacterium]|nr:glucosaminidase domain-containing protein [Candidatus Scybalousia scybalohippi]